MRGRLGVQATDCASRGAEEAGTETGESGIAPKPEASKRTASNMTLQRTAYRR